MVTLENIFTQEDAESAEEALFCFARDYLTSKRSYEMLPFMTLGTDNAPTRPRIPREFQMGLPVEWVTAALTIPDVFADFRKPDGQLKTQPQIDSNPDAAVNVRFTNNGRYQELRGTLVEIDSNATPSIELVTFSDGRTISVEEILERRETLLSEFLSLTQRTYPDFQTIAPHCRVDKDSFLYRALNKAESNQLKRGRAHRLLASSDILETRFESKHMFASPDSQAKKCARDDDHSGVIIRFRVIDPRLYFIGGFQALQHVATQFAHYLPREIEISTDAGLSFNPLE